MALGAILFRRNVVRTRSLVSKADERIRILEVREANVVEAQHQAVLEQQWATQSLSSAGELILSYGVLAENCPGPYVFANQKACESLGYSVEELLGMSPVQAEVFRDSGSVRSAGDPRFVSLVNTAGLAEEGSYARRSMELLIGQVMREGRLDYEGGFVTKNGRLIPAHIRAVRLDLGEHHRVVCFGMDLTAERRKETSSKEHERLLNDLLANAAVGVAIYDAEKALKEVNALCLKMFGCPDVQEFRSVDLFNSRFFPAEARERLARGESFVCEMEVDFDVVRQEAMFASSRHGRGFFVVHVTNLGVEKDFSARGFMVQFQDITALRNNESRLDMLQEELRQAKKMEAIGVLSGGIAHDFNNILTPILGYTDLGLDLCDNGSPLRGYLEEIMAASKRAKELVEQILVFSRRGETTSKPMRLTPIVKEVSKQVSSSAPEGVVVTCTIKTPEDLVLAMPTQIHQILMNLCSNAVYVMKKTGGTLEISLSSFVLSHIHKGEFPDLVTRKYLRSGERQRFVRLTVCDTGPGMSSETMGKIFEPFFTTKPSGEGTGMGLALVQGIVSTLGGGIRVDSELGKGATFHVVIPAVEEKKEDAVVQRTTISHGGGRVLFVDDEVAIVRMAEKMLSSLGYEAVVTSRSREALEMFRRNPDRFDVVITDQVMPDMTGAELTKEILQIKPGTPIVLCTGFSEKFPREKAEEAGIREFVMKPIVRNDLASAIERALGRVGERA
jgi:signal transduction histidine kinase/CheY-like chemotaxis protein